MFLWSCGRIYYCNCINFHCSCKNNYVIIYQWMQSKLDDIVHFSSTFSMKIILVVSYSCIDNYNLVQPFLWFHMQLQQVATTWTCKTNTLLVIKSICLDISHIVVAKIWSKWTTFLLMLYFQAFEKCKNFLVNLY
jgi:hypothetical protein